MINRLQLEKYIIIPTLKEIGMYSEEAVMLLIITMACESELGTFIKQKYDGPALGPYQMEPATYYDNWENNLRFRQDLRSKILKVTGYAIPPEADHMLWDWKLATVMARVHYSRFPQPIPDIHDFDEMVEYYHKYWGPNPDKTSIYQSKQRAMRVLFGSANA